MTKLRKIIDSVDDFRYSKHKLIRFTGFRFKKIVECGDFIKNKKRIKTKQCAPGWARISEKSTPSGVFFTANLILFNQSEGFAGDLN